MVITLVMTKSDGSSAEFPLNRQRTVIGRTNTCDLRIPVGSVSREHCEIVLVDGGAVVRDLGSSNGTYHNDIRVQEANLEAGDELTVGPVRFSVRINGEVRGVASERCLWELVASFKGGGDLYRASCALPDGESLETDLVVHGAPLHVDVRADVWRVLPGGRESAAKPLG